MTKIETLLNKWEDFDNYEDNDYREVFNWEALWIDCEYDDTLFLIDYQLEETLKELGYDLNDVIEKIKNDVAKAGYEYLGMLGETRKTNEW